MTTEEGLWEQKLFSGSGSQTFKIKVRAGCFPSIQGTMPSASPSVWRLLPGWACGHIAFTSAHIVTWNLPALRDPVFWLFEMESQTVSYAGLHCSPGCP